MNCLRGDNKLFFVGLLLAGTIFAFPNYTNAQSGSLYLSPSSGNVTVGQSFSLVVKVNTAGVAINAAEGSLVYDSAKLQVTSVSKTGSIFTIWPEEPNYSNAEGTIGFGGGVPNPGYNGSNGSIITIVFIAKGEGNADVNFKSGLALANDGYGTNELKAMNGASFNIGVAPSVSPKTEAPIVVSNFAISSSTHPDQNKWYSNNNPVFQFKFPSDARELNLILSRNEKSTPQIKYTLPISEKILKNVEDGVWYLNANYRGKNGLSPTIKYKIQVDTGLPENLEVIRKDPDNKTNPNPKFELRADDNLSGIDHYEAKIDNGEWQKLAADDSGYYILPFQTPGKKLLTVRVYDKAGNYIESSQELQVDAPPTPTWFLKLELVFEILGKGFDAILNFIFNQWLLLLALLIIGALVGQLLAKGVPHLAGEIEKIRYIASEYRASRKLKKFDSRTKVELKILEQDIKKELDLLNKIASHRSLHSDEQYLKNKLEKYYNILKKL